ncbi:MAG TPA: MFS transporter [Chloroflexota bacterium]|jgi:MFS family permease
MLAVLRRRDFAVLWAAAALSMLGTWVRFAALPLYVYETTGSTLATGAMFVSSALPMLLLGSLAGVFADRWDRKRVMVAADVLRALLLLPLLLVPSTGWIWIVYLVGFFQETVSRFADPAFNAAVPRVAGEENVVPANAAFSLGQNVARLVGPPLGGVLMAALGLWSVVLVDSVSFLLSAGLVLLVAVPRVERAAAAAALTGWRRVWDDWHDGLRLVARERWLTVVFVVVAVTMIAEGVLNVAYIIWVRELLGGGAREFGWLLSAQAAGSILGAPAVVWLGQRVAPGRLAGAAGVLLGLYWAVMLFNRSLPVALVLMALVGVPAMAGFVAITSMVQGGVADEYRGRVWGAFMTNLALFALVGRLFATLLGDALGPLYLLAAVALFDTLAGVIALALLRSRASRSAPARPAALQGEATVVG